MPTAPSACRFLTSLHADGAQGSGVHGGQSTGEPVDGALVSWAADADGEEVSASAATSVAWCPVAAPHLRSEGATLFTRCLGPGAER